MTSNPWLRLPSEPPYVLPEDKPFIEAFNQGHAPDSNYRINLDYIPEPRLGPTSAPVVILQLNPSYARGEFDNARRHDANLSSIRNESHHHLGADSTLGGAWWDARLRSLRETVGETQLVNRICSIEFFPYRSISFAHGNIRLPSQQYTFSLVRDAIKRKAIFVVTRNFALWKSAIPELLDAKCIPLGNKRSTYFTEKNIGEYWIDVVKAIRGAS